MREALLQAKIRAAVNILPYARFFRNSVGTLPNGKGGWVRFGLSVGSSDLIGLVRMESGISRFVGLEIKTATGKEREAQEAFRFAVNRFGGYVVVVRSVNAALIAVEEARKGVLI